MALIKKNLSTILGAFAKPLSDLDAFIDEQAKRKQIARNNIDKLSELQTTQYDIAADADAQAIQAVDAKEAILKAFPFLKA